MNLLSTAITGAVALLGVVVGGWLSIRNQDRLWHRDHARQWRDIRLAAYKDFVLAYRQYVAFTLEPTANITAVPHPRIPGELMPYFDQEGRPYKEGLEGASTAVRLVSESPDTLNAAADVVRSVRQIAAARATCSEATLPPEVFERLWTAQKAFLLATRKELGLVAAPRGTAGS
ncbi:MULTISPECIES: hypothetical protein [unclassified Streptomyces]|uniref:hypothetical protein n=1 Tax=unclassified Streptomyces TaxID=2593676 RepID=UPI0013A6C1C7|nr:MULTISPECIES: hypothetical protein [unclassified Streptomyces]